MRAREFRFSAAVDRLGRATAEGGAELELAEAWTPEHLLLAGLARCTLASLRYHADRAGIDVLAQAAAEGTVTRRAEDGRYAFVEIECRIEVELEPEPADVAELVAKAERDCFVGASLTAKPRYAWRVNGIDMLSR